MLMASVGQVPSDDELHEMIRIADADGSGSVDFCEFVTLMAHKMADVKSEGALKMSFSVFDATGDGYMDSEELRNLMINVGEPVTIDDVNTLIKEVDRNGDGKVDYEEFVKLIASEDGGRTVSVDGAPSAAPAKQKTKKGRSRQAREEEQMIDKSELRAAALNSADTEHRQRSSPERGGRESCEGSVVGRVSVFISLPVNSHSSLAHSDDVLYRLALLQPNHGRPFELARPL